MNGRKGSLGKARHTQRSPVSECSAVVLRRPLSCRSAGNRRRRRPRTGSAGQCCRNRLASQNVGAGAGQGCRESDPRDPASTHGEHAPRHRRRSENRKLPLLTPSVALQTHSKATEDHVAESHVTRRKVKRSSSGLRKVNVTESRREFDSDGLSRV